MAIRRNDPCPCGSGKKFKKCCLNNFALNAVEALPGNTIAPSKYALKCKAPRCEIVIPIKSGIFRSPQLCGSLICSPPNQPKWVLCPKHAREWQEHGHGCADRQHYNLWKTEFDFMTAIDASLEPNDID